MKLVLLGAPGSGKGTISRELEHKLNVKTLTSSAVLREAASSGTPEGFLMKSLMDQGKLVPDKMVIQAMLGKLLKLDNYILDGFPRTVAQAEALEAGLEEAGTKIDFVIYLDLPLEVAKQRNLKRLTCQVCRFSPLPGETVCPKCGGELVKRVDDSEDVILRRLQTYVDETSPLVDFYISKGKLLKIDADASADVVRERVFSALGVQ